MHMSRAKLVCGGVKLLRQRVKWLVIAAISRTTMPTDRSGGPQKTAPCFVAICCLILWCDDLYATSHPEW